MTHEVEMLAELAHVARFLGNHPLTRNHRTAAFMRFASFQLKARLNEEVIVTWIEGTKLAVRLGMTGATGNVYAGLHDFSEMAFLLHFLRASDYFYDVGANVGSYVVLASGVCCARSLAFEPDPWAVTALRRNVDVNGLANLVTVEDRAVGAIERFANFTTDLGVRNHVTMDKSGATRQIRMTTLDKLSADKMPTLIKIDVEGFNREVVEGAKATLSSDTLKAILIEWPSDVVDTLLSFGFSRVSYSPLKRQFEEFSEREQDTNTLFIRDPSFVQDRVSGAGSFSVLGINV